MKKKTIIALSVCVSFAALLGLTGCSGIFHFFRGASDERFPYEVAEERGEEGSRESWLASQEAPETELHRLYEEAVADGSFTGTFFEFLKELGVSNDNGAHIQTALRSAVCIEAAFTSRFSSYISGGSGVIYSLDTARGDALVITNFHVVYDKKVSEDIRLYPYGWEYSETGISASYVGGSARCDIAVLKIENNSYLKGNTTLKEVVAADSDNLSAGETVYALGNAEGMGMSVTMGVVSVDLEYALFEAADGGANITVPEIRTDAAVNHGNSGGGLFNASGELVGIVNGRSEEEGVVGFGMALPANFALAAAQNIIDNCRSGQSKKGAEARLGVEVTVTDSRGVFDARTGKFYIEDKVVVYSVASDSIGKALGFEQGDTLVSAKITASRYGTPKTVYFTRSVKWETFALELRRGDAVEFTVSRSGVTRTMSYAFAENDDFNVLR